MLKFHRPTWTSSPSLNLGIATLTLDPVSTAANCSVNMVHSDSISPASLELWERFSQKVGKENFPDTLTDGVVQMFPTGHYKAVRALRFVQQTPVSGSIPPPPNVEDIWLGIK